MPPKLVDGDQQRAAIDERVHCGGVGQLDRDQSTEPLHLLRRDRVRRDRRAGPDTAPQRTAGWARSITASAWAL